MLLAPVTPADVIGEALRLHLGPTRWPAVATLTIPHGDLSVDVEVLAASHRVRVRAPDAAEPILEETVACGTEGTRPVDPDRLPVDHRLDLGCGTYRFTSTTGTGTHEVDVAARQVRAIERGLKVAFPGHPDALTGIALSPVAPDAAGPTIAWTTHHVYPGPTPHVVTTSSTLTLRPAS